MPGEHARSALAGTRFGDVRWVADIDSTNRALLDVARQGGPEGVVLVTDHQSAGRGRLGRTWEAPPGSSLLVSVLLRPAQLQPPLPPSALHLLTMAVGLAAAEACQAVAGFRPGLKWPNDLLAAAPGGAERKLAGILAESLAAGGAVEAVVVGMGLNANWPQQVPPELSGVMVAANHVAGRPVDREALLVELLRGLDARYGRLGAPEGRAGLLAEYRANLVTLGRDVRVELAAGVLTGRAVDVTAEGALVVEDGEGGRQQVSAGDVVHLRPA